jgi:cell division transport system ATP-binding protein
MIRFEQVGKRYANGHVGLHELSFRVRRGEFLFVTGHSGAGKSTLLRLLLAMERPTSGKLLLAGQDLGQIGNAQIPYLRRQIGVVFQNHQLLFDRTVFNNVALPLQILGLSKAEIAKRVDSALERVALSDNSSASGLPAPLFIARRCCWRTNPPATSIRAWRPRSWGCSRTSIGWAPAC